jgi:hypothetical protein
MTTAIEFASPKAATTNKQATPWSNATKGNYKDMLLNPEYADRRLRFSNGENWLRILPAFKTSAFGWMLGLHTLEFSGGRYAHPKSLRPGTRSVFDHAYAWLIERRPEMLYSKQNCEGARLLSDPVCIFWALLQEEGTWTARLFVGSGYDGSRGGPRGLGYQIWHASRDRDEDGNLAADFVHPENGTLICIERAKSKDAKYPRYTLRPGRQPAPVDALIATLDSEELRALCPLEQAVRELTVDEEWTCLERVIDSDTVALIRADAEKQSK